MIPIDYKRTFTLTRPDANQLYVSASKATKVLKEWEIEATALARLSLAQQKRVVDLKKAVIDYEKDIKSFAK